MPLQFDNVLTGKGVWRLEIQCYTLVQYSFAVRGLLIKIAVVSIAGLQRLVGNGLSDGEGKGAGDAQDANPTATGWSGDGGDGFCLIACQSIVDHQSRLSQGLQARKHYTIFFVIHDATVIAAVPAVLLCGFDTRRTIRAPFLM